MAPFVIQGRLAERPAIEAGLLSLGVTVRRSLDNLAALSGSTVLIIDTPPGITEGQLKSIQGVNVVEGEFYHCFWSPLPPEPLPPPLPNELIGLGLQLLPPEVFNLLPSRWLLEVLGGAKMQEAGVYQPYDPRELPFGAPGLYLGAVVTETVTDLASILSLIQAPQAQQMNMGEGAIVAVMDSGVDPRWVPAPQRMAGWSDSGEDPWVDPLGHGSMVAALIMAVAPRAMVYPVKPGTSPTGAISSMGTLASMDHLAGLATQLGRPIITNHSWGIFGSRNLVLPCSVAITRTVRLLDEKGLVTTVWAAGNNRHVAGRYSPSIYCMNSLQWSTSVGAVDRNLRPHFYSSLGPGQCFPAHPTVVAPTFGILPWGPAYMDLGEQGGGTSSCAPQVSAALAMMMTAHPNRPFRDYRAALRASANNGALGLPPGIYYPATGFGLLQCEGAIRAVPYAQAHPSWALEAANFSAVAPLGKEP